MPVVPRGAEQNHHMFFVMTRSLDERVALATFLSERGISAPFHYVSLHLSPMGRRYGPPKGALPGVEQASARLLRLPLFPDMTLEQADDVIAAVRAFYNA